MAGGFALAVTALARGELRRTTIMAFGVNLTAIFAFIAYFVTHLPVC